MATVGKMHRNLGADVLHSELLASTNLYGPARCLRVVRHFRAMPAYAILTTLPRGVAKYQESSLTGSGELNPTSALSASTPTRHTPHSSTSASHSAGTCFTSHTPLAER